MAAFDLDSYAVTEERHNAVSRLDRDEIAVQKMLRYGLNICHWSLLSFWWLGLVVCANRRQARYFFSQALFKNPLSPQLAHFLGAFVSAAICMRALKPLSYGVCIAFVSSFPRSIPH